MTIQKVAVIGSGVMGSGIAAQIANAGIPVVLLDIVPKDAQDRNVIAKGAIAKMLKTEPAPFMHPRNAKLITPGNLEDDLALLSNCDWIVEVVLEDLKIKHATYEKIQAHRKAGSIVSSNTSTIPLQNLVEGQSDDFKKDFLITHFFNPVRYMRLLEIVIGDQTRKDAVDTVVDFCDKKLGKGIVECRDTPGFIVNRILTFWMQAGVNTAIDDKVSVEIVDAVMGKPAGIPKTGIFGLIDLVGIDLMPHLSKSLLSTLPDGDEYRKIYRDIPIIDQMITAGYTGRKGKGGFYRLDADRNKMAIDLNSAAFDPEKSYAPATRPKMDSAAAGKAGLRAVVEHPDAGGTYSWKVWSQTLSYAASLVGTIADNIADIDQAMRLGCNWKKGPFELIDDLGPKWFADKLKENGMPVPAIIDAVGDGPLYKTEDGKLSYFGLDGKYHDVVRPDGVILLADIKRANKPVFKTGSAKLWDIGDHVLCLEFIGKMNALDDQVFAAIHEACDLIENGDDFKSLIVYNEGPHFSAGANLGLALFAINIALWPQIEELVAGGQEAYKRLKYAPFPTVVAPAGMALGGGCEILLHASHVQAHAELYCGLVEVGVGVIPGWGGCKEMLQRFYLRSQDGTSGKGMIPHMKAAFETIGLAKVARSADDARAIGYLRETDGITMNRDRLLFDAKQKAVALIDGYTAPEPMSIPLPGPSGKYALDLAVADLRKSGKATPYDVVVCDILSNVLSGGPDADTTTLTDEETILELERNSFMHLVKNNGTMDRIEHMLSKGKPLRN